VTPKPFDGEKDIMSEQREKLTGTIPEAAEVLQCGINTAYEAARRGQIPVMEIGKRKIVQWQKFMRLVRGEVA
jgi:hypothetical protein